MKNKTAKMQLVLLTTVNYKPQICKNWHI